MTQDWPWQGAVTCSHTPPGSRAAPILGRPVLGPEGTILQLYTLQPTHGSGHPVDSPQWEYAPDSKMGLQEPNIFYQSSLIWYFCFLPKYALLQTCST